MNRHRNQRNSADTRQLDLFGRRGGDPFAHMHQVMRSFGGGMSSFGSDLISQDFLSDPFEQMMNFSNAHKGLHNAGKQGSYVCQTFVSSSKMGPDGKMKNESYFQNSAGQHLNGQTISQKQQAYKNNQGVKRIAEERMLNDQGRKVVREKRGNQPEEMTNHYYNLDEGEAERFDSNWRGTNQQLKFLENHQKYVQSLPYQQPQRRQLGLGYEPRREQPHNIRKSQYQQPLQQGSRHQQEARQPLQPEYRQPIQTELRPSYQQDPRTPLQGQTRGPSSRGMAQSRGNYSQKGSSYKYGSRGGY